MYMRRKVCHSDRIAITGRTYFSIDIETLRVHLEIEYFPWNLPLGMNIINSFA